LLGFGTILFILFVWIGVADIISPRAPVRSPLQADVDQIYRQIDSIKSFASESKRQADEIQAKYEVLKAESGLSIKRFRADLAELKQARVKDAKIDQELDELLYEIR